MKLQDKNNIIKLLDNEIETHEKTNDQIKELGSAFYQLAFIDGLEEAKSLIEKYYKDNKDEDVDSFKNKGDQINESI
jgi:hypothetical protein